MDDTQENPAKDFNKLDLSQLQGFSFGTQWTQDKPSAPESRDRGERPRRDSAPDRRDGPGGAPDRRDRRAFRKPLPGTSAEPGEGAGAAPAETHEAPARREFSGDRGPRREFRGPRRDGPGYGPRGDRPPMERGPYESPFFSVAFYPEDTSFNALAKTIRSSCRTIELFEIARTVIGKNDRFVVVLTRRAGPPDGPGGYRSGPGAPAPAPAPAPAAPKQPIYLAVPDGVPFESEEATVAHVLTNHLSRFFDLAEVEVDPPKGNFLVINRCGVTGELLGPPNYHRYAQIVQQHYAAKIARMPFDVFRNRIETVRDPEVVAQWLEKMKKTTRYTWKAPGRPAPIPPVPATEPAAPAAEATAEAAPADSSVNLEPAPAITFDNFEDARSYLLTQAREKVWRPVESARFHGKLLEKMPPGEIRRAIEGALERQQRFPLDTANALRGRLRREHFTIFKKGSKGVSYVCAVKRKFRVPGQTFAETISALITFIEATPMVRASELPTKFLGIATPPPAKAPEAPAVPAEPTAADPTAAAPVAAAPAEPILTIDERARISRMQGDLRWLVTEGYVTEFIDGRLFAPPPMVEARKKEVEAEEHDPENFPEVPASTPPFEAPPAAAPAAPATENVASAPAAEPSPAPAAVEAAPEAAAETAAPAPAETVSPESLPAESPAPAEPVVESAPVLATESVPAPVSAEPAPAPVPTEPAVAPTEPTAPPPPAP